MPGISVSRIPIPFNKGGFSYSSYWTTQYDAVYNAMTEKPGNEDKYYQSRFLKTIVDAGVFAKLDVLYVFNVHTNDNSEALINWANPGTFNGVLATGVDVYPAFEARRGFLGNYTGQAYIETNYNPTLHANKYKLDDASIGVYIRKLHRDNASTVTMGQTATQSCCAPLYNKYLLRLSGSFYGTLNSGVVAGDANAIKPHPGMYAVCRYSATNLYRYFQETQIDKAINSNALVNVNYTIFKATSNCEGSQLSMAWIGGLLTSDDINIMRTAFEVYRKAVGDHTIVIVSDSICAERAPAHAVSELMDNDDYAIADLSVSADKIENQKDDWDALSDAVKINADAVFVMIGINNVIPDDTATILSKYQTLIDAINADVSSTCKVIGVTMIPMAYKADAQYLALNAAILNGTITGLDTTIDTTVTALNDGTGGLAAAYDSGDTVHPNEAGRQIIADLWDAKLTELGL